MEPTYTQSKKKVQASANHEQTSSTMPAPTLPNSVLTDMLGGRANGGPVASGNDLEAYLRQNIPGNMQEQIPAAEREADAISLGVQARSPEAVKTEMGERMGADFSDVQFHTSANAQGYADTLGARAYTTGSDIYFGEGGFDPAVAAHELVHTAQQGVVESGMATTAAPTGGVQMQRSGVRALARRFSGMIREQGAAAQERRPVYGEGDYFVPREQSAPQPTSIEAAIAAEPQMLLSRMSAMQETMDGDPIRSHVADEDVPIYGEPAPEPAPADDEVPYTMGYDPHDPSVPVYDTGYEPEPEQAPDAEQPHGTPITLPQAIQEMGGAPVFEAAAPEAPEAPKLGRGKRFLNWIKKKLGFGGR